MEVFLSGGLQLHSFQFQFAGRVPWELSEDIFSLVHLFKSGWGGDDSVLSGNEEITPTQTQSKHKDPRFSMSAAQFSLPEDGWMDGRTEGWMDGWVDGCRQAVEALMTPVCLY